MKGIIITVGKLDLLSKLTKIREATITKSIV
jgi:hypothetical protein